MLAVDTADETTRCTDALVGHCFHTFVIQEDGCRLVQYQGRVTSKIADTHYLVTYFDWLAGVPSTEAIHTLNEMLEWQFYPDADAMNFQWDHRGLSSAHERHERHIQTES